MEEDQSAKFIHRMFSDAAQDRIAILAVPRSAGNAEQRVATLAQASSPKYLAWLRHLNARDYDIYLCVNPIRPGSRGREKEDIAEVRRLQLDLDEDGPAGYARLLEDVERAALPRPAHILRSSKDRYQFLWDTVPNWWSQGQAEAVMRGPGRALRRRPCSHRRGSGDAAAGFQELQARQGPVAGHLDLVWGPAGEARGFRWVGPARAEAGQPC